MRNILIYSEPWLEDSVEILHGRNEFLLGFLKNILPQIHEQSINRNNIYKIHCICSDISYSYLSDHLEDLKYINFYPIQQSELLSISSDYKKFHFDQCNPKISSALKSLLAHKIGNLKPDLIYTTTENKFLDILFPNTLKFINEAGMFGYPPYNWSNYYDNNLAYSSAFHIRYKKELEEIKINEKQKNFVDEIRDNFLDCFNSSNNPFKKTIEIIRSRSKFSHIIALALQPYDASTTFLHHPFKSNYQLIIDVLDEVDKDIGVIITEHRFGKILSKDIINHLKIKYENFIYIDSLTQYKYHTQLILPYVDGLITISSTLGFQASFYKKSVYSPMSSNLSSFSDASNLKDFIESIRSKAISNKDSMIYFLLTHYWIPGDYIVDGKWMYDFFERSINKHLKNQDMSFDFFERIDTDNSLIKKIIKKDAIKSYYKNFVVGKKAIILNDTQNWYHHGCTGTSIAIKNELKNKGYEVNSIPINQLYDLSSKIPPQELKDFDDDGFFSKWREIYKSIFTILNDADLVVINGEGTFHSLSDMVRSLLYIIYIAKVRLNKGVRILNHSCYPDDKVIPENKQYISFYKKAYEVADFISAREYYSYNIIKNFLGIKNVVLSFDSLPIYINKYYNKNTKISFPEKYILISGGICLNDFWRDKFFQYLSFLEKEYRIPVYFIIGADDYLAPEDTALVESLIKKSGTKKQSKPLFNLMLKKISAKKHSEKIDDIKVYNNFMLYEATSVDNWLTAIKDSYFFVSGRYHHSIASYALNTPFIAFESNTPKTNAIFEMMDSKNILIKNVTNKISNDELLEELIEKTQSLDKLHHKNRFKTDYIFDLALRNYD